MKKLMILAAVAAMGAMSAKATIDEAFGVNAFFMDETKWAGSYAGYQTVYILTSEASASWNGTLAGLKSAQVTSMTLHDQWPGWDGDQYCMTGSNNRQVGSLDEAYAEGAVVAYLTNGEDYFFQNSGTRHFDGQNVGHDFTFEIEGSDSPTTFAAVPEPTSGLLLLLGVAGLALKRKRA